MLCNVQGITLHFNSHLKRALCDAFYAFFICFFLFFFFFLRYLCFFSLKKHFCSKQISYSIHITAQQKESRRNSANVQRTTYKFNNLTAGNFSFLRSCWWKYQFFIFLWCMGAYENCRVRCRCYCLLVSCFFSSLYCYFWYRIFA